MTNLNVKKLKNVFQLSVFLLITIILSCKSDDELNLTKTIEAGTRTSLHYIDVKINTQAKKITTKFDQIKTIEIISESENTVKINGVQGLSKVSYDNGTPKKLILTDSLNQSTYVFFDDDNDVIEERPCCSRSTFKAWYSYFKNNCEQIPECDAACDYVPCGTVHYISALTACCTYGGMPNAYESDFVQVNYSNIQ